MRKVLALSFATLALTACGDSAEERQERINYSDCSYAEMYGYEHNNPERCERAREEGIID